MPDERLNGPSPLRTIPGAAPASLEKIGEIVRGATIRNIRPAKAIDPDMGGECVMIELNNGDALIFIAVPNQGAIAVLGEPTAKLQPVLIHRRNTRLHV